VPTSANERITAAVPSGSPHATLKASREPSTMMSAWRRAITRHPSTWPTRIVRVEVGVERMRRAIPSRRVSISQTAPLSEVREMNSSCCVLAPPSNRLSVPA
jgi:hypothetical protein